MVIGVLAVGLDGFLSRACSPRLASSFRQRREALARSGEPSVGLEPRNRIRVDSAHWTAREATVMSTQPFGGRGNGGRR